MVEQPELDLPPPASALRARPPRRGFAGLTRTQLLGGAALLTALIWAMWVTRAIVAPHQDKIVTARLSGIVGDYVSAEARSASPPAQVEAEMKAFLAGLDRELQRRSAHGEVVLVGEAVLTKNVPDITDSLKRAVYASGVPMPRQASATELGRLQPPMSAQPAPVFAAPSGISGQGGDVAPSAGGVALPPNRTPVSAPAMPVLSGPAVSTFGGPNGGGDR